MALCLPVFTPDTTPSFVLFPIKQKNNQFTSVIVPTLLTCPWALCTHQTTTPNLQPKSKLTQKAEILELKRQPSTSPRYSRMNGQTQALALSRATLRAYSQSSDDALWWSKMACSLAGVLQSCRLSEPSGPQPMSSSQRLLQEGRSSKSSSH